MQKKLRPLAPGTYRLAPGVRLLPRGSSTVAFCDYPLRIVPLSPLAAQLLSHCSKEQHPARLAADLALPTGKIAALCEQLRWKGLLLAGPPEPLTKWPPVSIVVPSYNRSAQLARCLRSLLEMDYPALEIIVVDDGSTDDTSALLQDLEREATSKNIALRTIRHACSMGAALARNSGTSVARYDFIAYIDSDCVASPAWLKELVPAFRDHHITAVGGMIRAYERRSLLGCYEDVCSSLCMGTQPRRLDAIFTYLPTANFLLRRTAWQRIDGFSDLRFGEDVDFCRRLLHSGAQIHYLPYGVVYHDYRTTLQTFAETRIVYASSEATLQALHPEMRRVLLLPPVPASFAGLLILAACSLLMAPFSLFQPAFSLVSLFSSLAALLLTLITSHQRHNQVQAHGFRIASRTLLIATLRAHLSYTYHLCRHLTRYYTLPLVLLGLLFPPLLLLPSVLYAIVIGVDYTRLRPTMSLWHYILVALLDDCSYALGVLKGCLQRKTWKPLVPLLKKRLDA